MKITEITPKERRFNIELSEDQMHQLLAVCWPFNGRFNHSMIDLRSKIDDALGHPDNKYEVKVFTYDDDELNLSLVPIGGTA